MATIDDATLKTLQGSMGGDASAMREILGLFLDQSPRVLAEAASAARAADAKTLHRCAHTLKSSAAMFGAKRLSQMCRELEAECAKGVPPEPAARVAAIEGEYALVADELRRWPTA